MALPAIAMRLQAPFTITDQVYTHEIEALLTNTINQIRDVISAPLLACVTLWIIVQGILVIRGDVDTRHGVTKLLTVAFIVALVSSSALYTKYVEDMFKTAIPEFVKNVGNDGVAPLNTLPEQIDAVFLAGEGLFLSISERLPSNDPQAVYSYEGAQFIFCLTLWGIFGVYDLAVVMNDLLISIGPLLLLGFLFEATRDMTMKWIGQLISYALLFLFISVLATVVVAIQLEAVAAVALVDRVAPTAAAIIGLFDLDIFMMTGNAIVVALPGLAAALGGGVAVAAPRFVNSLYRRISGAALVDKNGKPLDKDSEQYQRAVMNRFFMTGNLQ
jgi:type IV secretion system protein VirB6